MAKLKKGDITLREMIEISKVYYTRYDDKKYRKRMDVKSASLSEMKNFAYDPMAKEWKQTEKRHIKFTFMVSSKPISYKRIDTVATHNYPVTFVFFDFAKGMKSAIKWRTGSQRRVKILTAGQKWSQQDRINTANYNIKNMRQLDFFFKLENILARYGLLYGIDTTNGKLPTTTRQIMLKDGTKKTVPGTNPETLPYIDKTALFVVDKFLVKMTTQKGIDQIMTKLGLNKPVEQNPAKATDTKSTAVKVTPAAPSSPVAPANPGQPTGDSTAPASDGTP